MSSRKLFTFIIIIFFAALSACGNDTATQDEARNLTISSISTNSPSTDYPQTQSAIRQGQGFGNNFRPISMQSNQGNPSPIQLESQQILPDSHNQSPSERKNYTLKDFEKEVVELTNKKRQRAGLSPLEVDSTLSGVAREKSKDMQANNYFTHTGSTYGSPFDMMAQYGVTFRQAGENIARDQNTPKKAVRAWMNSEGHRKNILNGGFTHIGVGYVEDGDYWTQMFIRK